LASPLEDDFARALDEDFLVVLARVDLPSDVLARALVDLRGAALAAREPFERAPVLRVALDLVEADRALLARVDGLEDEPDVSPERSSLAHLPDMTR
jgi:hypothetical protein